MRLLPAKAFAARSMARLAIHGYCKSSQAGQRSCCPAVNSACRASGSEATLAEPFLDEMTPVAEAAKTKQVLLHLSLESVGDSANRELGNRAELNGLRNSESIALVRFPVRGSIVKGGRADPSPER